MTVKELKKLLAEYPDDYTVILSTDSEGNQFSHAASDITEVEEIGGKPYDVDLQFDDEEEEGQSEMNPNAIIIWPT